VLTSDNGMAWGSDGFLLKNVPAADRLPLFFSGPGIAHGETDALVSNIDFGPTLADLAGTTMPKADGKSFVAALDGSGGGRKALLEDHPVGGPTGEGDVPTGPWWGVRTPQWHLVVWNGVHLYDTISDPWEKKDVAERNKDVVAKLAATFHRVVPPPAPSPSPTPSLVPITPAPSTPTPTPTEPGTTPAPTPSSSPRSSGVPTHKPRPTTSDPSPAAPTLAPDETHAPRRSASPAPATVPSTIGDSGSRPPSALAAIVIALLAMAFAAITGALLGRRLRPKAATSK
jgi:hypothetical protein